MVGSTILILCTPGTVDIFDRGAGGGLLVGLFRATRIRPENFDEPAVKNFEEDVMEIGDVDSFEGEFVMSDIGSHVGLVLFIG